MGAGLAQPQFAGATVQRDDDEVAREWLAKPQEWRDREVVRDFERAFADWNGSFGAAAFMSGREAFSSILQALGIGPGDEVVVPAYTCVVVPNAVTFRGAGVVFCDIELDTYGVALRDLARRVSSRTKAIVIQHLYGLVGRDTEGVIDFARRRGIAVIEDCAHAAGATYNERKVGNFGTAAFFSTEQTKSFTTLFGGLAASTDEQIVRAIRDAQDRASEPDDDWMVRHLMTFRLLGASRRHPSNPLLKALANARWSGRRLVPTTGAEMAGRQPSYYGRRMTAPIAAIGLNQLRKLDAFNATRRKSAGRWERWADKQGYRTPRVIEGSTPTFLRYPVLADAAVKANPRELQRRLGVPVGVWFRTHTHPVARDIGRYSAADEAVAKCINLPTLP